MEANKAEHTARKEMDRDRIMGAIAIHDRGRFLKRMNVVGGGWEAVQSSGGERLKNSVAMWR